MAKGQSRSRALLVFALAACGRSGSGAVVAQKHDAAPQATADSLREPEIVTGPLGMPDFASFGWRKRAGQPAFRTARKLEARDDWAGVVDACKQALSADPGHLEASWLLAVALAKTGKPDQVLAPLQVAVAGDFGKWAQASLDQPALQAFLATPTGQAWRRYVESARQTYVAALARSVVVTAGGDLYGVDPDGPRWVRLTHTFGGVIGGLAAPGGHRIAYVTYQRARTANSETKLGVGIVDLGRGHTSHPVSASAVGAFTIAYSTDKHAGFWIGGRLSASTAQTWRELDDDGRLTLLPPKTPRPSGPWLDVIGHTARIHRLPVENVTASWDDQSLASAIRIGTSNRVVAAPSPGLVDGNTATWSPDHAHLAFVAIDDHCVPGTAAAAAFVAEGATGGVRELERARGGLAVEWLADRRIAIAGDHGVTIVDLGNATPTILEGATGLVTPRRKPRCTPEPVEEPVDEDPAEPLVGDEPSDAGISDAPSPH